MRALLFLCRHNVPVDVAPFPLRSLVFIKRHFIFIKTNYMTFKHWNELKPRSMVLFYVFLTPCFGYLRRMCVIFCYFLISHYQSTAGGDLSMLFPLHAGFEPTLPRWLSAGWKGYYISYDTICIGTVKVIHWISPLSRFTGYIHFLPIDFHTFCTRCVI